mmetsp:Transcript_450/g.670  ORF Transcript_450/g.670 Transcript_450/m.670 type:complete len:143 (-) Transcript_450:133-561(-)
MLTGLLNCGGKQAKQHKNRRRTLRRQIEKIEIRMTEMKNEAETKQSMATTTTTTTTTETGKNCNGERRAISSETAGACSSGSVSPSTTSSRPPCRTCNRLGCDGRCWGFWAGKSRPWKRRKPTTNSTTANEEKIPAEEEVKS